MGNVLFILAQQPPSGAGCPHSRGFLITLKDAPLSVGLLWTSDQSSQRPLPDNTQHSQLTDIHVPGGIRTHNLSSRAAAYLRLRAATGTGDGECTALNYITKTETSAERCPCLRTANRGGQHFLRWGPVGVRQQGWGKKITTFSLHLNSD